ncbi:hypothetical protein HAX54_032634 [Datura stramonium]|uniref:Uncharacterized protein n=1 Tax=Datura stramonium TaxID=4076 RepID=A0ABS8VE11_DATST|nr:hypothetical protein [Datura stramonium]
MHKGANGMTDNFALSSETCQEIAMVNRPDSFTDMPKNQDGPGFPSDPEQVPYAYQKSTPNNNQMMLTRLEDDDDILECINELLALHEEPGKSCIMHLDKHKDHSKLAAVLCHSWQCLL